MFKVKITGLNGKQKEFASLSAKLPVIVEEELFAGAKEWEALAKRDAPKDQGTLVNGIAAVKTSKGAMIASNAFYSAFMEFGTKGKYRPIPGTEEIAAQFKGYKGGDIGQMLRMIERWVARKRIAGTYSVKTQRRRGNKAQQQGENKSLAWVIAMAILRNGVRPHPFFFKQQDIVWPQIVRNIERRIARESGVKVIMPGDIRNPKIVTV